MTESPLLLYSSIILFAVISWAMYKYVLTTTPQSRALSSSTPATTTSAATNAGGATTSSTSRDDLGSAAAAAANNNASNQQNSNNATNSEKDESSFANFHQPKRHPPHLYNPSSKQHNVSTLDNGGIIPFKLTFASGYETRLSKSLSSAPDNNNNGEDLIITNRKQRARLFAKLFSIADRPPNRGSNVVVIIPYDDGGTVAKCHKLQKSLMLLGTYYNLFLLVDHKQQQKEGEEEKEIDDRDVVKRFRNDLLNVTTTTNENQSSSSATDTATKKNDKLTPQILPPHRIIFTSTPEGKVAFVRQLHEAKLVLLGSKEDKVKVELERFGFRVVSYLDEKVDGDANTWGVSTLGQFLLP